MEDLLADAVYLEQLKKLFKDLSENLSQRTKRVPVPFGTMRWRIEVLKEEPVSWKYKDPSEIAESKTIIIPLINVFGHYIGYNAEADILVMAAELRRTK